jgi:hypothetical protein
LLIFPWNGGLQPGGGELRRDRYNQKGNEFARGSFEFNGTYTSNPSTRRGG